MCVNSHTAVPRPGYKVSPDRRQTTAMLVIFNVCLVNAWSAGKGGGGVGCACIFYAPTANSNVPLCMCVCVQLCMCVSVAAGVEACTIFVALIAFRLHAASYE